MTHKRELTPESTGQAVPDSMCAAVPPSRGPNVATQPRRQPRIRTELSAVLSTVEPNGDASYTLAQAKTVDIADGGIGLTVDEAIDVGQRVVVEFELDAGLWLERSGRVAWCSNNESGSRSLGIAFDTVLSGLAACASSSPSDSPASLANHDRRASCHDAKDAVCLASFSPLATTCARPIARA